MTRIQIYSTRQCPYCVQAKTLLQAKGLDYTETDVADDIEILQEMITRSGKRTVPQIFIDGNPVGGYDELSRLNATGKL